jgi:hypothetical protein
MGFIGLEDRSLEKTRGDPIAFAREKRIQPETRQCRVHQLPWFFSLSGAYQSIGKREKDKIREPEQKRQMGGSDAAQREDRR